MTFQKRKQFPASGRSNLKQKINQILYKIKLTVINSINRESIKTLFSYSSELQNQHKNNKKKT